MYTFKNVIIILVAIFVVSCSSSNRKEEKLPAIQASAQLQTLKENFIEKRFGMFICFNIMSYGAKWGEANYPIDSFNPQKLDCNQWADAAVSAGITYGLLTTKHHEGFCLWDSKYTEYDVTSTPYKNDIVQQYVDAFRAKGLGIGLYYSIWDSTHNIDKGEVTPNKIEFIKGQITELLSNYGKVDYFVIDGWNWRMGHKEVPFREIRELIRQLQPECLITDHTHLQAPYHMDIPYFEGPFGAFPPEGSTMAATLGHCSVDGNGWFWSDKTPNGMKENDGVDVVVDKLIKCERRYCNFMLNCMPNREGLLDDIYIKMLDEIGEKWKANENRPVLPDQGPQIWETVPVKEISATSGNAGYLVDGEKIAGANYYDWISDGDFPQTIIIDLGEIVENVGTLLLVNKHQCKPGPEMALTEGNINKWILFQGTDGVTYKKVAEQQFIKNPGYNSIGFKPKATRYLKLIILDAKGGKAIINELEVGKPS